MKICVELVFGIKVVTLPLFGQLTTKKQQLQNKTKKKRNSKKTKKVPSVEFLAEPAPHYMTALVYVLLTFLFLKFFFLILSFCVNND
jgi:hypothetical protein